MFRDTTFYVKRAIDTKPFEILVHTEAKLSENPEQTAKEFVEQLGWACIQAYEEHKQHISADPGFKVNTCFVECLSQSQTQSFAACNYLYINNFGQSIPDSNHYMIQLQQTDYYIGVDVSVQQYRKDKVIAEITLATSSVDSLTTILNECHHIEPKDQWDINYPQRNDKIQRALKIGFFGEQRSLHQAQPLVEVTQTPPPEENPQSSCVCVIL